MNGAGAADHVFWGIFLRPARLAARMPHKLRKEKTSAVVIAAGKVVVGREGAEENLKKTVNCGECHGEHKP